MPKRRITLDLDGDVELYATENNRSDLIVASLIEAIVAGDKLRPITVCKNSVKDNVYFISNGHHRALAHYILGIPIECVLLDVDIDSLLHGFKYEFNPIGSVVLKDHPQSPRSRRSFLRYRPVPGFPETGWRDNMREGKFYGLLRSLKYRVLWLV